MPALNRFYNPTQTRYQSQFVPKNLPVDLMAKTLYGKQERADQMQAATNKLGEWDQAALEGHDTEYVKEIKNELQSFIASSSSEDRTSPEFQRKYLSLVNKIKTDENLKSIQAAVDTDTEHQKRVKALKEKGDHAYASWLDAQYQHSRANYTKEGGLGFKGDLLHDPTTMEGNDLWSERTKYFKELKDSGSDAIKYLGSGIAYKTGWDGISNKRIKDQLQNTFDDYSATNAGKEDFVKNLYDLGYVTSEYQALPKEEKNAITNKVKSNMKQDFLEAGLTYVHGKSTTNIDAALNSERRENLANADAPLIVTAEKIALEETAGATRDKQIKNLSAQELQLQTDLRTKTLTAEGRRSKELYLESISREKAQLQKEHTAAWKSIVGNVTKGITKDEQGKFNAAKMAINGINVGSSDLYATLIPMDNINLADPRRAKQMIEKNLQSLNNHLLAGTSNNGNIISHSDMIATQDAIKQLRAMQTIATKYDTRIKNKWNENFYTKGENASTIQVESVTASDKENSVMSSINQSVQSNPAGFKFRNSRGEIITGDEIGGRVKSFKGGQFTIGNAANSDNFGAKGKLVYLTEKKDDEGNVVLDKNKHPVLIEVIQEVTAIPQGANQQFNKDNIAKEYYKRAYGYRKLGDEQSASAAEQVALTYRKADLYNELRDFQQDAYAPTKIVKVRVPTKAGESGISNVVVKKIGDINDGGGYEVMFNNNPATSFEVNSIDEVLAEIDQNTK